MNFDILLLFSQGNEYFWGHKIVVSISLIFFFFGGGGGGGEEIAPWPATYFLL